MSKFLSIIVALVFIAAIGVIASFTAVVSYRNQCTPSFKDEFTGRSLDTTIWSTEFPPGNNGEQQYYGPDAFQVKDGILNIYAEKKPSHGYPYTSGIITTQQSFAQQYGYFVIRAKLPRGQGFWPGFWMLPAIKHYPVEIDVFELLGHDPFTLHLTNHWRSEDGSLQESKLAYTGENDFSSEFHKFAIDWNPDEIKWYVDGVLRYKTDQGVPSEPLYLLVNLAVGGHWPGNPDKTTTFPGVMQIDYIRAYKLGCYLHSVTN